MRLLLVTGKGGAGTTTLAVVPAAGEDAGVGPARRVQHIPVRRAARPC